jgi:Bacterial Ig-like domain (group 3)
MKCTYFSTGVAAFALCALTLQGATATQQARITLVEHNAAPGAMASADPSIARRSVAGRPDQEAHIFGQTIQVGAALTEVVEVSFHAVTPVTTIQATNDFHVVGGSCRENQTYNSGDTCSVAVEFKAMGPGHRAGQLKFSAGDSAQPEVLGLQGNTLGAAIAFTPAIITTLPQTVVNGSPLLFDPGDLNIDQGDNLYFTDQYVGQTTNSGELYMIDASETLNKLAGGGTTKVTASLEENVVVGFDIFLQDPIGVAIDPYLNAYIVEGTNDDGTIDELEGFYLTPYAGLGTTPSVNCIGTPCSALTTQLELPTYIKTDVSGNIFYTDSDGYYTIPATTAATKELLFFPNSFSDGEFAGLPFALDSNDNVFTSRATLDNTCQVEGYQPYNDAQWAVAGSGLCGYAGNNVRAQNAEISQFQGGMAMDAAGDLYMADSANNVLRRVDNYNGFIRTVAGDNALGANYTGDGGPATSATLNNPVGVAVDSNGVIYTASFVAGATLPPGVLARKALNKAGSEDTSAKPNECVEDCGPAPVAVIRKIGPNGQLNFPATLVGKNAPTQTILLTNVGNDNLVVSNTYLAGTDPGDFVVNPYMSSCTWGTATPMASGHSCQLGYYCSPKAAGVRTAILYIVDNTATFSNEINLSCYGVAAPVTPTVVVNPPAPSSTFPHLSAVPFTVSVTNTIPATPPTGTVLFTIKNVSTNAVFGTYGPYNLLPGASNTSTASFSVSGANLKVGSYTVTAAYNGDSLDVATSSTADPFSVTQLQPVIGWPTAATFTAGGALGASQLDALPKVGNSLIPGTLAYTISPSSTVVCTSTVTTSAAPGCTPATTDDLNTVGTYTLTATFTPTDTVDYKSATGTVPLHVVQLVPTITWPTLAAVSVGQSLGATQFDAKATYNGAAVAGTYAYSLGGTNLSATLCSNLDVSPACTAAFIVPQSQSGLVIELYLTFTPTNTVTYAKPGLASVGLPVNVYTTVVPKTGTTLRSRLNPTPEGDIVDLSAAVQSDPGAAIPTGTVTVKEGAKTLATVNLASGTAAIALKGLGRGTHLLTAEYSGDEKHAGSSSEPLRQLVVTAGEVPLAGRLR